MGYLSTYLSLEEGKSYPVRITRDDGTFCDIEFDPEVDNLTMLNVPKKLFIKEN